MLALLRLPRISPLALLFIGCSDDTSDNSNPSAGSGGSAMQSGGASQTGGRNSSGGSAASGGLASGGSAGKGGAPAGTGGTITIPSDACAPRNGYRNLFAELLGKTETDVQDKLDKSFQHFFRGGDNAKIYYESGADEAYILDVNNDDVRSEGMSYGMMVAVQMDKQDEFDRLWKWAKVHTQQPNGYFAWRTTPQGQVRDTGAAPDGEEYFATALIFAAHRWSSGKHDYAGDAQKLLDALRNNGAFNSNPPVVKFVPSANYSDPSYVLPAFYQIWSCFDSKNRMFWSGAITHGRSMLKKATHAETGLGAYLSNYDGTPHNNGPNFNSDSWRIVGNIMMDHHFYRADPWQVTFAEKYNAFFTKTWATNPNAHEFTLSGSIVQEASGPARGLVAMNSLVAFALPPEAGKPPLQKLWDMGLATGQYRYYDGFLYLFALLHASGKYQIY